MNGRFILLLTTFFLAVGGFGLIAIEYFYKFFNLSLMQLLISGIMGLLGFVGMIFTIREYMRNWYWHEVRKEHAIIGIILFVIALMVAWHYGVVDWLISII